jgi:betaine reductase
MTVSKKLRVVHYLNQFFGGLGSEEQAHQGPQVVDGAKGPGRAIQNRLGEKGEVVATAICGDDYAGERIDDTAEAILRLIRPYHPDILIAGPAFEAGRYGVACGAICKKVQEALMIPVVTGMYAENPGVDLYHQDVYIVQTGDSVKTMDTSITAMVNLALKLAAGQTVGKPAQEGYFPRGILVNEVCDKNGAARAVAMLLDKLKGQPFDPEVIQPTHYPVSAAPRIRDMGRSTIALVTDGGLVPAGNPDGIETKNATRYGGYGFKDVDALASKDYDISHSGYANVHTRYNPNRLIPVDAMRDIEREKGIGKLHERFYSTTGVATRLEIARKMGRAIAAELKSEGVSGAILTST